MPATGKNPEIRLKPMYRFAAACVFAALCAASAFGQTSTTAPSPSQSQILDRIEAQARAYKDAIPRVFLQVEQTVSEYDDSGHLKHTSHSSYRYSFEATGSDSGKDKGSEAAEPSETLRGAVLSDGVTLPLIFLPGSIPHLTIHSETPKDGTWIVHFKSTPCNPPTLHRHWMSADVSGQCVEGKAFLDPSDGTITRIRMEVAGLPVFFRGFPLPTETEIFEIYNDASFHMLKAHPGAKPQLVPAKARYVIYTSRRRTVVDQVFRVFHEMTPQPKR
jgi:hypothetical protein